MKRRDLFLTGLLAVTAAAQDKQRKLCQVQFSEDELDALVVVVARAIKGDDNTRRWANKAMPLLIRMIQNCYGEAK